MLTIEQQQRERETHKHTKTTQPRRAGTFFNRFCCCCWIAFGAQFATFSFHFVPALTGFDLNCCTVALRGNSLSKTSRTCFRSNHKQCYLYIPEPARNHKRELPTVRMGMYYRSTIYVRYLPKKHDVVTRARGVRKKASTDRPVRVHQSGFGNQRTKSEIAPKAFRRSTCTLFVHAGTRRKYLVGRRENHLSQCDTVYNIYQYIYIRKKEEVVY